MLILFTFRIKLPTPPHISDIGGVADTETTEVALDGPEKKAPIGTRKEVDERKKLQVLKVFEVRIDKRFENGQLSTVISL